MDAAIRTAQSPSREREFLDRRRAIITWCDRHLTTIHALTALMTDDPDVVTAGLAELLAAPPAAPSAPGDGSRGAPAHRLSRDRCPADATALDRVELALALLGDRDCASVSRGPGMSERMVSARLGAALRVLYTSCDGQP